MKRLCLNECAMEFSGSRPGAALLSLVRVAVCSHRAHPTHELSVQCMARKNKSLTEVDPEANRESP